MTAFAPYYDPKLKLDSEDPVTIAAEERIRISRELRMVQTAQTIPRRLGDAASPEDMSKDKKRCRRVAHALQQPLEAWGGPVDTIDMTAEAAKLDWKKWGSEEQVYLKNRMRLVATLGTDQPKHKKWAKQALTRFQNEARWVEHALR